MTGFSTGYTGTPDSKGFWGFTLPPEDDDFYYPVTIEDLCSHVRRLISDAGTSLEHLADTRQIPLNGLRNLVENDDLSDLTDEQIFSLTYYLGHPVRVVPRFQVDGLIEWVKFE